MKFFIKLFIGLALILLFFSKYKWHELIDVLVTAHVSIIVAAIVLQLVNLIIVAFRWYLLLNAVDGGVGFLK